MTLREREEKQAQGRRMYVAGFDLVDIVKILGVSEKTLRKWKDEDLWEDEKELAAMKPARLKRLTLECALAIERKEPLPYKADDISKIVAAFDRITDSRKVALYSMESMDCLTNFILEQAGKERGQQRERLIDLIKEVRPLMDKYITMLLQND